MALRFAYGRLRKTDTAREVSLGMATTDELLSEQNGSKVFSKLDRKWGLHQIPLAENSRAISTFITHRGP